MEQVKVKQSKIKPPQLTAIPTNIITGFLGAGKTSAILHLLANKPTEERWAILVNEFGKIGVDGSLVDGQFSTPQQVYVREVPGGCMCCTAGAPMQVALNQLLKEARPHRLLIEPTGLGHPKEFLKVLSAPHYQKVLSLQKTLTLVDARQLNDSRYTSHDTFNQQISIADTVIGNKIDLYQEGDKENLQRYVEIHGHRTTEVSFSQQAELSISQLFGPTHCALLNSHQHMSEKPPASLLAIPECGFLKAINTREGFNSVGWRFSSKKIFNYKQLQIFLSNIHAERIKAVLITDQGVFGYNITADGITESILNTSKESRIEILSPHINDAHALHESELMACLM
jgi:G3E family GTPase